MKLLKKKIEKNLKTAAIGAGIENPTIHIEHPEDPSHGDFSSNLAMVYAKNLKLNPKVLAEKIVEEFKKEMPKEVLDITVAGSGFINIKIIDRYFAENIIKIDENFGKAENTHKKEKVMIEYTDPNPFKEFHIGHLMSNAIGESIACLTEFAGREVKRANWQGDVGPHVAKAIWGAMKLGAKDGAKSWGKAYAHGAEAYDSDENAKKEINEINKKIYNRDDEKINALYDQGRKESLEAFEKIYQRLGTKFNNYFFEGIEGRMGEEVVRDYLKKGVFEESEGAIIFPGEKHGLHTRVFITSQSLPTYEAKELGLNIEKFKLYPDLSLSIIITANEQNDYFKVLLKAFSFINKEIFEKTRHIGHGMMRLTTGKMGSRKGNVVTAENFIGEVKKLVMEKIKDRDFDDVEKEMLSETVAIAAIKYQVLRQSIGGDIIYDPEESVSFEGDSGPYLQYACVRAGTILKKAQAAEIPKKVSVFPDKVTFLEKLILRFPEVVNRAQVEFEPHHITTYLTELAATFNAYYTNNLIIDSKNPLSPYRVVLTKAFVEVMKNGLWLLGIKVPERM